MPRRFRKLFRYRSITAKTFERELNSIRKETIWCSNYRSMNDPMEGYYSALFKLPEVIFQQIFSRMQFTKMQIGLASFTETNNNELMWAHYAGNYTGICIEYDYKCLERSFEIGACFAPINYASSPLRLHKYDIENPKVAAEQILLQKKASWQYEREWRLLASLGKRNLLPGTVRRVYLGARIPEEFASRLIRKVRKQLPDVHFSKMVLKGYRHEWRKIS